MHHSRIHSPGETDYLFDHLNRDPTASGGWRCDRALLMDDWKFHLAKLTLPDALEDSDLIYSLTDMIHDQAPGKLVAITVHRKAPAAAALFPNAKFIHLLRDPRDAARSAVGMGWDGNSYYGVRHWLDTETNWNLAGIPHDQVLTIRFEELMQDLKKGLTAICTFLELEFEAGMLEYHKNSTYGPPNPNMSQKWRVQATPREIARIEGRVGSLLQSRGYKSAYSPVFPSTVEKVWLRIDNSLRRWRYNIRRYGFRLFVTHHMARLMRLKSTADRLAARQLNINIKNLK